MKTATKTATLPSLRVDPALRKAAESVLEDGETLSAFVEASVRKNVERRKVQKDFLARALAAEAEAEASGKYYTAEEVLNELEEIVKRAEARSRAAS